MPPGPPPADRAASRRRAGAPWAGRAAVLAAVLGVAVRLEQFAWRRSLWLDEALVANNIVGRSFAGLLHPLTGQQAAPIGWLWSERAAVVAFGDNEYALRLAPLLAGILALPLVYALGRRIAGPWSGAAAIALVAWSPAAVRYSVEVKQYSTDMALSLAVIALASRAAHHPPVHAARSPWPVVAWGAAGAVVLWASHPAVLVLAATAAVLCIEATWRRAWREAAVVVAASSVWLASFAVEWVVSLRALRGNRYLHSYWRGGLAPEPLRWSTFGPWLVHLPARLLADPLALPGGPLVAALLVAGVCLAARRRPVDAALLVAPAVVGVVAACAGLFPLEGRMALWLLPAAMVATGAGLAWLALLAASAVGAAAGRRREPRRARRWVAAVVAVCCFGAVAQAPGRRIGSVAHDPATWIDIRPLLQVLGSRMLPGDQVWVHSDDAPAAAFYARATGVEAAAVLWDARPGATCPGAPLAGVPGRVWVVFGYQSTAGVRDAPAAVDARLARLARLVARIRRPGITASLWDGAGPPSGSVGPPGGAVGCMTLTPPAG